MGTEGWLYRRFMQARWRRIQKHQLKLQKEERIRKKRDYAFFRFTGFERSLRIVRRLLEDDPTLANKKDYLGRLCFNCSRFGVRSHTRKLIRQRILEFEQDP